MKIRILIFCLATNSLCNSQTVSFDYYYKTERSDRFHGAAEDEIGNYFLIVTSDDESNSIRRKSEVIKLNNKGQFVKSTNLNINNQEVYFTNILKVDNNNFIIGGSIKNVGGNNSTLFLTKIDSDLNTLWFKSLKDSTNSKFFTQIKLDNSKKELLCIGNGVGSSGFIAKFNLNGDSLFQRFYNFQYPLISFFEILESELGKYYLFAYGVHMPNEPPSSEAVSKMMVLNQNYDIDTIIKLETSLTYPHLSGFVKFDNYISSKWLTKKDFILGGNLYNPSKLPPSESSDLGIMSWDTNYVENFYSIYGDENKREASQFTNLDFIDSSNIYLVGTNGFSGGVFLNQIIDFYVIKINSLGQKKWEKTFSNNSLLYHQSILATTDGGLLILGQSYKDGYNNIDESDAYALKIDSTGFAEIWPVGLDNDFIHQDKALIYPNPFSDKLRIRLTNNNAAFDFYIYDVTSRLVFHKRINNGEELQNLNQLKSGIYIYKIIYDNFSEETGKLIKN